MRLAIIAMLALTTMSVSCRSAQVPPAPQPESLELGAEAIIGRMNARFVFPNESTDQLTWPTPIPHAYEGFPTLSWEVSWRGSLSSERLGTDPDQIVLILRWRPEAARNWQLHELVARFRPKLLTFCLSCGTPAAIPSDDPAVRVFARERRIIFEVSGEDAIRRIFPVPPDAVTLTRRIQGEAGGRVTRVVVQHREP